MSMSRPRGPIHVVPAGGDGELVPRFVEDHDSPAVVLDDVHAPVVVPDSARDGDVHTAARTEVEVEVEEEVALVVIHVHVSTANVGDVDVSRHGMHKEVCRDPHPPAAAALRVVLPRLRAATHPDRLLPRAVVAELDESESWTGRQPRRHHRGLPRRRTEPRCLQARSGRRAGSRTGRSRRPSCIASLGSSTRRPPRSCCRWGRSPSRRGTHRPSLCSRTPMSRSRFFGWRRGSARGVLDGQRVVGGPGEGFGSHLPAAQRSGRVVDRLRPGGRRVRGRDGRPRAPRFFPVQEEVEVRRRRVGPIQRRVDRSRIHDGEDVRPVPRADRIHAPCERVREEGEHQRPRRC